MKKMFFLSVALCTVFAFSSCKSTNDMYKSAYDEALTDGDAEGQGQQSDFVEIAPVSSTTTETVEVDERYRTEKVELSSGDEGSLKAYSVVCGSYGRKEGAERIRAELIAEGYDAIIVKNENNMYRVICASFNSRREAAEARAQFKAAHPDNADYQKAWLLYNK